MSLNDKPAKGGKEFFLIPEDTYIAKLYSIIDLGDQDTGFTRRIKNEDGTETDTGEPQISTKVMLTYELSDVLMDDGRPAVISAGFAGLTASFHELAQLRKHGLAALGGNAEAVAFMDAEGRTAGEVLEKMLDKPVLLTIVHAPSKKTGKVYANIGTVSALPKKDLKDVKDTVNPRVLVLDANNVDPETQAKIPKFIQDRMAMRLNALAGPNSEVY